MRDWLLAGVLLVASPAWAADPINEAGPSREELAQMNAATRAWDRYAELSRRSNPAVVGVLADSSVRHFGFLRDLARFGSPEQLRRVPSPDRTVVYCLRATRSDAQLAAMDDNAVAALAFREGWAGVADDGDTPHLSHVTLISDTMAVGELGPPTGAQFQFGPDLVREKGQWKVVTQSLTLDEAQAVAQTAREAGMSETQMAQAIVAHMLGDEDAAAASLSVLDRPLRDDPALRTRLNESWPDYAAAYGHRVLAVGRKADDGDGFAQFVYGMLLYSGESPEFAKQDKSRGLAYLEKASENGNVQAAWAVASGLMTEQTTGAAALAERSRRALPHVRRAAEAGIPEAMAALGSFYFNGAGGIARDCRIAEEWQARAEDAGHRYARNDRVWSLAACPIGGQRDPARALQLAATMIEHADELAAAELDTVAAAYAANGRFAEATDFQKRAIMALAQDDDATRHRMQNRLQNYQSRRPWTQSYNAFELSE
ncbi:tetratricopeptide repeat protein [Lysobacter sp. LF1]|uniref:Tetratricopeptide repeat protein n=1 Tax=Lysobacter stagni TaxID=3045172 RepID=A0ABT6XE04_9GAMM|nr:tetratricopeptide repeat protein [Lysobacter sp. LF1]MDI9238377.1 tetratricopeptide repeat protein [Lysobacter sp. LF1]